MLEIYLRYFELSRVLDMSRKIADEGESKVETIVNLEKRCEVSSRDCFEIGVMV